MALLHARGELGVPRRLTRPGAPTPGPKASNTGLEEDCHHESIVDTIFTGRLLQQVPIGCPGWE
jgi:hypothetical protein